MLSSHRNAHLPASFFVWHISDILCTQCRTFDNFKSLKACGPYLSNETVYYMPAMLSEKKINDLFATIESAISPNCFSNLLAFGCRTWFRECREVSTDSAVGSVMLPSLMVREAQVITPQNPSDNSLTLCSCSADRNVKTTLVFGNSASMKLRQMRKQKRRWAPSDSKRSVIASVSSGYICLAPVGYWSQPLHFFLRRSFDPFFIPTHCNLNFKTEFAGNMLATPHLGSIGSPCLWKIPEDSAAWLFFLKICRISQGAKWFMGAIWPA